MAGAAVAKILIGKVGMSDTERPPSGPYLEDWFKIWLALGWTLAILRLRPLELRAAWVFAAIVPLAHLAAWFAGGGRRHPKTREGSEREQPRTRTSDKRAP